jgi:hypothetical protein
MSKFFFRILYTCLILFFYVLFSQIYPFLHFHAASGGETAQPVAVFTSAEECPCPHDEAEHHRRRCDKEHFKGDVQVALSNKQRPLRQDIDSSAVISYTVLLENNASFIFRLPADPCTPLQSVFSLQARSPPRKA